MEHKIKVLSDAVASQIAAGEVVQRPASVVKELLENAIDAGAKHITLNVKDAGRTLIQVIDDGCGMSEIDARLCIERHATSKISSVDDIYRIHTMGFRGEAMASIAAVSQLELKTMTEADDLATIIQMSGSDVLSQEAEQGKKGTSVQVKNLFFNVPARRNFLKSNNIEYKHILETFQQIALTRPDIGFHLYNNGNESYKLDKSSFRQRIIQLFGKRFDERLVPIVEQTDIVEVEGFVTKPEYATLKRGEQFFLVNDRYIKNPYLHHAIMLAFEDLLSKDMHPQYFIKLKVDPAQIDVNIHPTKTEVKFLEERSIYAILRTTIRQSLGKHNIAPSLDFERETVFDVPTLDKNRAVRMPEIKVNKDFNPFKKDVVLVQQNTKPDRSAIEKTRELYDFAAKSQPSHEIKKDQARPSKMNSDDKVPIERSKIIQLHNKFILTHIKSGFMIIDQHRAHQRVLYERFLLARKKESASQQLLFPVMIDLSKSDFDTVRELTPDLERIGFSIGEMGKESISISGAPPGCNEKEIKDIFTGTIEHFKITGEKEGRSNFERLAKALAAKMAIRSGQKLAEKEMEDLVDKLFGCDMPYALPNGKPIVITMPLDDLDKRFQY